VQSCCAPLCFCAIRRIPLATYLVSCGLTCLSRSHKEVDSYSPAANMRQVEISCLVYGEQWVVDEVKTMPLAARPHSPAWLVVWQYARLGNTTQQQSFTCLALGFALGPYPTLSQINFRYLISLWHGNVSWEGAIVKILAQII